MSEPTSNATENQYKPSPPKKNMANTTNNTVVTVIKVRRKVSVSEISTISVGSAPRILRKFSRIRSNTTMVSLSE